ncbi:MAG: signal peptide peptidase SppA [Verrucomicrobiia bacterium]|jgi:protease-4
MESYNDDKNIKNSSEHSDSNIGGACGSAGHYQGGKPPEPPPIIKPIIYQQQPQKKSKVWLWFLLALGLVLIGGCGLVLSSFSGLLSTGESVVGSGPRFIETVIEDNSSPDKILVIEVSGIIYDGPIDGVGTSISELIKKQLKKAALDKRVKAVILKIDSPGGEVLTADEIYRAIEDFQESSKKPVVASMGSVAASGGYYIAAPCRWIVANKLTITGSIGVILSTWNYRGLMNKVGIKPEVFKSGKFKDMLSGQRDLENMSPEQMKIYNEERQMVQKLIDETFEHFKSVVKKGRGFANELNKEEGKKLATNWTDYVDGRILSGKEAYELGFVDELGNFDVAVERAKKLAGITADANLIQYQIPFDIFNILKLFGKSEAKSIKIDIGMEPPKIQTGKMYFISPSLLY